jgi:CubicO group peptidase (beta-lactamase class C family)
MRRIRKQLILGWALCAMTFKLAAQTTPLPQTGPVDADFAGVDTVVKNYLTQQNQPGASVVIAYGDRIIYAQGYGYADRDKQLVTSPWMEYRLASTSKTLTATAIMKLVEQGKVSLDASAWSYIASTMGITPKDSRVLQVTVRQLLTHSWGMDRAVSAEPNGGYFLDANGKAVTASRDLLRNYLQNRNLDFAPGAKYAYNGIGFSWLQLIAEIIDGRPLDKQLSAMMGAEALSTGIFRIGSTLPSRITEAEPHYYDEPGAAKVPPVPGLYAPPAPALVDSPYGQFTLDAYGGGGGLITSAFTLTRFIQRLQGIRQPALLSAATWNEMQTEQKLADNFANTGLGIQTVKFGSTAERWYTFNGSLPGSRTGWVSTPRFTGAPRVTVVALVNGRSNSNDNIIAELVTPVLFAVDAMGAAKYGGKSEISNDRLISWETSTEAYFGDQLFEWGQRTYPSLLKGTPACGSISGYRYRYYADTQLYVGMKEGRLYLYQPTVSPNITALGTLVDFLPTAQSSNANQVLGVRVACK